jgi:hypothetical protein
MTVRFNAESILNKFYDNTNPKYIANEGLKIGSDLKTIDPNIVIKSIKKIDDYEYHYILNAISTKYKTAIQNLISDRYYKHCKLETGHSYCDNNIKIIDTLIISIEYDPDNNKNNKTILKYVLIILVIILLFILYITITTTLFVS